jgi:hypothetical protein
VREDEAEAVYAAVRPAVTEARNKRELEALAHVERALEEAAANLPPGYRVGITREGKPKLVRDKDMLAREAQGVMDKKSLET